jgi:hypothetical protein
MIYTLLSIERDAMLTAFGTPTDGVLDTGTYKQAYFKFPDPNTLVTGADISALVTGFPDHSNIAVHFSRNYLANSAACQGFETDCSDVSVCPGITDSCRINSTGDIYVTVDSNTVKEQISFNLKADIICT